MKIERLSFMGSTEEFQRVAYLFAARPEDGEGTSAKTGDGAVAFARHLLTRRRIPHGQLALFRALYAAGDEGLPKARLAAEMNRTEDELYGVMGALGRRINRTAGVEQVSAQGGTSTLLETRVTDGEQRYVMRPSLRQVLEELKLVRQPAVKKPDDAEQQGAA